MVTKHPHPPMKSYPFHLDTFALTSMLKSRSRYARMDILLLVVLLSLNSSIPLLLTLLSFSETAHAFVRYKNSTNGMSTMTRAVMSSIAYLTCWNHILSINDNININFNTFNYVNFFINIHVRF